MTPKVDRAGAEWRTEAETTTADPELLLRNLSTLACLSYSNSSYSYHMDEKFAEQKG